MRRMKPPRADCLEVATAYFTASIVLLQGQMLPTIHAAGRRKSSTTSKALCCNRSKLSTARVMRRVKPPRDHRLDALIAAPDSPQNNARQQVIAHRRREVEWRPCHGSGLSKISGRCTRPARRWDLDEPFHRAAPACTPVGTHWDPFFSNAARGDGSQSGGRRTLCSGVPSTSPAQTGTDCEGGRLLTASVSIVSRGHAASTAALFN